MAAAWIRARAELRRRWRSTVLLSVLVGLVGGVALFGVTGARRTSSAMERFLAYYRPFDAFVFGEEVDHAAVAALPQVADVDTQSYLVMVTSTPSGEPDLQGFVNPSVSTRNRTGTLSQRPLVVAGRPPDPDQALEVALNEGTARAQGLSVGDGLRLWAYAPEQFFDFLEEPGTTEPAGPPIDLTVTAVVRHPSDVSPDPVDEEVSYSTTQDVYLTPAFAARYRGQVASFDELLGPALVVRLAGGADDLPAFTEAVRALPGAEDAEIAAADTLAQAADTQRAIDLQALALLAFAALVAGTGVLVVGQSLNRQVTLDADEHPALRAMGITRRQLMGVVGLRAMVVAGAGALLAVVVALALSPLSPIGLARSAEVSRGFDADVPVLVMGALAVVAAVCARTALAAWRVTSLVGATSTAPAPGRPRRRPRVGERLAAAGAPANAVIGVSMAVPTGAVTSALAVRSALLGATLAAAAVAGGLAFTASLDHLIATPALQGWTWDVTVGDETIDIHEKGQRLLGGNPVVGGFSAISGSGQQFEVGGASVGVTGLDPLEGQIGPPILDGRLPRGDGEVAFGPRTMEELDLEVGQDIEVSTPDAEGAEGAEGRGRTATLSVVGVALVGPALNYTTGIGEGALVSLGGMERLFGETPTAYFLVDYAGGTDPDAAFASLQAVWGRQVLRPLPAPDVENLRRVSGLPVAFSALVAILGVATLGHTLTTTARRHRHDIAVLRALGFSRRQVASTFAWQATTLAALSLVVGLPLGVAGGRWAWQVVAGGIGTPTPAVIPLVAVVAAIPLTLLVANALAALPARRAARLRPALALRAE